MIQITIFNYEAFYLDFLEGNLNEENTALLLDFLKDHPELKIDELPDYQAELIELEPVFRDSLKQVDHENDRLTSFNCESFIIAYFESQLSKEKEFELLDFVKSDSKGNRLFNSYKNIKLQADQTVFYPNRNELKRSNRIVLWPYMSAAASILVIFGSYILFNQKGNSSDQVGLAVSEFEYYLPQNFDFSSVKSDFDVVLTKDFEINESVVRFAHERDVKDRIGLSKKPHLDVASISKKDVLMQETNQEVRPNRIFPMNVATSYSESEVIFAATEMKNPIKPVTERLSDFTKTEIDLKTASAVEKGKKGFYIKIGNFEVERKKH